ncbi:hypothetical protein QFZ53_002817 [Microbacterium natoriense]|uniref:Uncharacterized protein n=1 Tax=Microbacterium natoriense TaxID=284570 RepID=A0AAW8EZ83_9MICO|nr:hypothetical protein [Microbacterium natoriense]MDQ0648621.1 hypothetical protein [Microbacterium natoriense]
MTNNTILQAHIDQFDQLWKTAAEFQESVLRENRGMIFTATFEVFLTEDLRISAGASVGSDGELLDVNVYFYEYDGRDEEARVVADLPVELNSGLWRAMEIWLEAMRNPPESDSAMR